MKCLNVFVFKDFKIHGQVRLEIDRARQVFEKTVNRLDLSILEYPGFGKEKIKKFKFYPDGIMQLAFQVSEILTKQASYRDQNGS